jgi:hypothetical protein
VVTEIEKAAEAIRTRYGSPHAFCKAHPALNRTTVYQVLAGTYNGNIDKQLGRILAALEESANTAHGLPTLTELETCIRDAACPRCPLDTGPLCKRCAPTHLLQAQAVLRLLTQKLGGTSD